MKNPLKVTLLFLAAVSLLLVGALSVLLLTVNPNHFKPDIESLVLQRTGRALSIPGDIQYTLFPRFGVSVGRMSLANAAAFSNQAFAEIEAAEASVKVWPLLSGKLELGRITLSGLTLNFAKSAQGQNNWDDLLSRVSAADPATPPEAEGTSSVPSQLSTLTIEGFALEQGHLNWDDRQQGKQIQVSNIRLTADKIAYDQLIPTLLEFTVKQATSGLTHTVSMETRLAVDAGLSLLRMENLQVSLQSTGAELPGAHLALLGSIQSGEYQRVEQRFKLDAIQLAVNNAVLKGDVSGRQLNGIPDIAGKFHLNSTNVRQFMQQQGMEPLNTQDPNVLSSLSADLAWHFSNHTVVVDPLTLVLDETHLTGSMQWQGLHHPNITFSAKMDRLDVDRYLSKNATPPMPILSSALVLAATNPIVSSLEQLKTLDVNGSVAIGQFTMKQMALQDVILTVKSAAGQLHTHQSVKQIFKGAYQGDASVSFTQQLPQLQLDENITHMELAPLLFAFMRKNPVTGWVTASARLHGEGASAKALKSSLAGTVEFLVENGAIQGLNLQAMLDSLQKFHVGNEITIKGPLEQSVFTTLKGTATINQGIIENRDLIAVSPTLAIQGEGSLDLTTDKLAYNLHAGLANAEKPLSAMVWPLNLTLQGSLEKPSIRISGIKETIEQNKALLQEKKTELLNKLNKTLEKKLGIGTSELLKKLF